jgi:hypothetical protein
MFVAPREAAIGASKLVELCVVDCRPKLSHQASAEVLVVFVAGFVN